MWRCIGAARCSYGAYVGNTRALRAIWRYMRADGHMWASDCLFSLSRSLALSLSLYLSIHLSISLSILYIYISRERERSCIMYRWFMYTMICMYMLRREPSLIHVSLQRSEGVCTCVAVRFMCKPGDAVLNALSPLDTYFVFKPPKSINEGRSKLK